MKNDSLELLKKAEKILISEYNQSQQNLVINRLLAITYNNLGCYYRKDEKPNVALNYLKKALTIEVYSIHDSSTIASTHLNICAILSRLKKHDLSVVHAKIAIELLGFVKDSIIKKQENEELNKHIKNERNKQKRYKDIMTMLVISYYNLAIEQEYLKQFDESISTYQIGYKIALQELGSSHKMTQTFINNIKKLQQEKQSKEQKENEKQERKQRQQDEGFHSYIKKHIQIDVNNIQHSDKTLKQSYLKRLFNLKSTKNAENSSQSPNKQNNIQSSQEQEYQQQIDHFQVNTKRIKNTSRAQTVIKNRNEAHNILLKEKLSDNDIVEKYGNNSFLDQSGIKDNIKQFQINQNRRALQPLQQIAYNNLYNINYLQVQQKRIDKLPQIQNVYDPQISSFENHNQFAQETGYNTQSTANSFISQQSNQSQKYDKYRAPNYRDKYLQNQSNTIQYEGYNIQNNNNIKETQFSTYNKQAQANYRRNSIDARHIISQQNTYDFNQKDTLNNQNQRPFQDSIEYSNMLNTINISDKPYKKNKFNFQNSINYDNKQNYYQIDQFQDNKSQFNVDRLQGMVRKSLNFNENKYKQFVDKQPDEREQTIQEQMDKQVDIYQSQNESMCNISQDSSLSNSPQKYQNIIMNKNNQRKKKRNFSRDEYCDDNIKQDSNYYSNSQLDGYTEKEQVLDNKNDPSYFLRNSQRDREIIDRCFREYEQKQQLNSIQQQQINQIEYPKNNAYKINPEYQNNISSIQNSQLLQQTLINSPRLPQFNQNIKDNEQIYNQMNIKIHNKYQKRPYSNQDNFVDQKLKYNPKMNEIQVDEDNTYFNKNEHQSQNRSPSQQPNRCSYRSSSVNTSKSRQHKQNDQNEQVDPSFQFNSKQIKLLQKNSLAYNTINETEETPLNNLSLNCKQDHKYN